MLHGGRVLYRGVLRLFADSRAVHGSVPLPWIMSDAEMARIEVQNVEHRQHTGPELLLLDIFDFDDPAWLRQKDMPLGDRIHRGENPMKLSEIRAVCGMRDSGGRSEPALHQALSSLTSAVAPFRTTMTKDAQGNRVRRTGRFWPMPPLRDGVFDDAPPAPPEDRGSVGVH